MTFPTALLWITSVLFIAFGVGFVVAPKALADLTTNGEPNVPSAVTDMRAVYGGVALGLGLFIGYCARRRETVRLGLWASLFVVASIGLARLIGMIVDGSPNAFMVVFFATEIGSVVALIIGLRQLPSET